MKRVFVLKIGDNDKAMVVAESMEEAKEVVFEKGVFGKKINDGLYQYDCAALLAASMEDEEDETEEM
jgi:hypothetical protein